MYLENCIRYSLWLKNYIMPYIEMWLISGHFEMILALGNQNNVHASCIVILLLSEFQIRFLFKSTASHLIKIQRKNIRMYAFGIYNFSDASIDLLPHSYIIPTSTHAHSWISTHLQIHAPIYLQHFLKVCLKWIYLIVLKLYWLWGRK